MMIEIEIAWKKIDDKTNRIKFIKRKSTESESNVYKFVNSFSSNKIKLELFVCFACLQWFLFYFFICLQ